MRIPVNAKVVCTNGSHGKLHRIIVDRPTRTVTHLVVDTPGMGSKRVVPVQHLADTTSESVVLKLTKQEVDQMPGFTLSASSVASYGGSGAPPDMSGYDTAWMFQPLNVQGGMPGHTAGAGRAQMDAIVENIDEGEVETRSGQRVEAEDGYVGDLKDLIVDAETFEVKEIAFLHGYLWDERAITIPLTDIDRVSGGVIFLNLNKAQVKELPSSK